MAAHLVILAAGKGTRMKSDLPKVLHEVGNAPLFAHAVAAGRALEPETVVLVAGHGAEAVAKSAQDWAPEAQVVVQEQQLGTAHAALQARAALAGATGTAFVLYGDTPFVRPETLEAMEAKRAEGHAVVVLGFEAADPGRYGRLIVEDDALTRIVEFKDATEAERAVTLCNSGVIACDAAQLFALIDAVGNDNASGEYYLTDIIEVARERGLSGAVVTCDEAETLGVNTPQELARAEAIFQQARRAELQAEGVGIAAPETLFLSLDTHIGPGAVIEPNVVIGPGVTIEGGARIRAFSHLEGCHVGEGAVVGPYARLRPGAEIGNGAKIGNFVEVKEAEIGEGAKVNHLSYVGDARIGPRANLGAGTITCNYDGVMKHRTSIGADAFIGSNTMLVAPVTIGQGALTGSGSVITEDVPDGALAVARAKQVNKPGLATRLFEKLKAAKARKEEAR